MIREFAFGITNRHHFKDCSHRSRISITRDVYMSLWDYDEYVTVLGEDNG